MKILKIILLISLFTTSYIYSFAQRFEVESTIDTNQILIGDQVLLSTKISGPKDISIGFPNYTDTLSWGIEIIENYPIDTVIENDVFTLIKKLKITSFDTGAYMLPIGPFTINSTDTITGRPVFLSVNTFAIDTSKGLADIKLPYEAPITFSEILPYLIWILIALIIAAIGIYTVYKLNTLKNQKTYQAPTIPLEPPHVVALRELDKLKTEKLWQNEKTKLYYSRLTEIIRMYIEYRFEIPALEQTTAEIITSFKNIAATDISNIQTLQEVFSKADLVKFAKYIPEPQDNEQCFNKMYDFVMKTKENKDLFDTEKEKKEE